MNNTLNHWKNPACEEISRTGNQQKKLPRKVTLTMLLAFFFLIICKPVFADSWIMVEMKINEIPVRFALDTGAPYTTIFSTTATRLGLNVKYNSERKTNRLEPPRYGMTEKCRVTYGDETTITSLLVAEMPSFFEDEIDGVLAWADVRNNILSFDIDQKEIKVLDSVPDDVKQWSKFELKSDWRIAVMEIPTALNRKAEIWIDTGFLGGGVELSTFRWKRFARRNPDAPKTPKASYSLNSGFDVSEERWARKLKFGAFVIYDVPVQPMSDYTDPIADLHGMLGLYALTRLHMVIDGISNVVYVRPNKNPRTKYCHNSTGVAFVPTSNDQDTLIAYVIEKSMAHRLGVRNGDVLLKIDNVDLGDWWRSDNPLGSTIGLGCKSYYAGELLTLQRGDKLYSVKLKTDNVFPKKWSQPPLTKDTEPMSISATSPKAFLSLHIESWEDFIDTWKNSQP